MTNTVPIVLLDADGNELGRVSQLRVIGAATAHREGQVAVVEVLGGDGQPLDLTGYVRSDDPRLADARTPTAHGHDAGELPEALVTEAELAAAVDEHETTEPHLPAHPHPYEPEGEAEGEAAAAVADHLANDPHGGATEPHAHDDAYVGLTDPRLADARTPTAHGHALEDLPAGVATELEAAALVNAHEGESNPHPGYVGPADPRLSDARAPTAHGHTAEITAAVDDHVAGAHAGLATDSEVTAAVDAHVAGAHGNLATDAELAAAVAAHEAAGNPHAGYATDADLAAHALTPHGGAGALSLVRKVADQAFNSTAFADSTGLAFGVAAGKAYKFRFVVFFTTNAATVGIKLGVNGPAGATVRFGVIVPTAAPAGAGNAAIHATGAAFNAEAIAATAGPGTAGSMAIVEGILVTGANAGTLQLRHASETASATTILANSFGELAEVA